MNMEQFLTLAVASIIANVLYELISRKENWSTAFYRSYYQITALALATWMY